nr:MAG TPA: hypothetical protein [Caudoviricetes sp.]DAO72602.1 MAG TPA: hypothetical protein [Caudoviricetes sp.]
MNVTTMKILFVHKLHVTRGSTERNDERCVGAYRS